MHSALSDDWGEWLWGNSGYNGWKTIKTNLDSTLLGEKTMKSKHWIRSSATASLALAFPMAYAFLRYLAFRSRCISGADAVWEVFTQLLLLRFIDAMETVKRLGVAISAKHRSSL